MRVEYSAGGLSTRANKTGGRFYVAVFKYRDGGRWRQRKVILTDEDGERIPADKGMTRNKKAANKALERARRELGNVMADGSTSVPEYMRQDFEGRRGSVEDSTIRGYLEYMPLFESGLSDVAMRDIKPKDVRLWVHGMTEAGKAPTTIRKAFNLLSNVCERAMENDDLQTNPCTGKIRREDLPKVGSPAPNALDAEGIRRVNGMLDTAKNPRLRVGARLALHCGLRAQEVCGLRWRDVDLKGHMLHVRNVIGNRGAELSGDAQYAKGPKSAAGSRDVPVTETVAHDLTEWREAQRREWRTLNGDAPQVAFRDCYVVGYADGTFYAPHSLERLWGKVARGVRPRDPQDRRRRLSEGWEEGHEPIVGITGDIISFHGLRHTYATGLIKAGTDVKAASALLGHSDAALTLRVYAAADPDAITQAVRNAAPFLEMGTERMRLKAV